MNIEKFKQDPRMPKHIAFIVDGNGRWATKRNLTRSMGHEAGFENLKKQIEFVQELGIKNLSMYCFSCENWKRSKQEVDFLMELFNRMLDEFKQKYINKDIRFIISGNMNDERLPLIVRNKAKELMELTKDKNGFVINACINYGGRQEILKVVNELIESGVKIVDEKLFEKHLYTAEMLPLDFVIRTSGEKRLSNFLTWQSTYSEWYFPKKLWPSFNKKDLIKALKSYMKRDRRFGAVKA